MGVIPSGAAFSRRSEGSLEPRTLRATHKSETTGHPEVRDAASGVTEITDVREREQ